MDNDKLLSYINKFEEITKRPEKYLSLQEDQAKEIKSLTKNLYDFTKQKEKNYKKVADALDKLGIINLDEEQIWQQVELQNSSVCDILVHDIAHLLAKKSSLKFPIKKNDEIKIRQKVLSDVLKKKNTPIIKKNKNEVNDKNKSKVQKQKSSVVDDKFFKLHEMKNFLEKVEKGENLYESDDEIDYFEDGFSNLNDNDDTQLHYKDFFDEPEEENFSETSESNSEMNSDEKKEKKKVTFLEVDENKSSSEEFEGSDIAEKCENDLDNVLDFNYSEEDGEDEIKNVSYKMNDRNDLEKEESESDECNNNGIVKPSTFEARQKRLEMRIKNLEEEALSEKPWQLKGEVTASSRPQNSLLEEYVEFDIAARPAPVLTEKTTLKLEDIIIQRIKDKAWDDVVRKFKPVENDIEYKKKIVLDQEKSKLSLAQIYEQEYLKQLEFKNELTDKFEVEPPEHQEIRIMMNKLFYRLDALSNFHFTPKQVQPEAKIISNVPALNMEEVAPVATSDAALLAPEEVKPKLKGNLIGKSERTKTDKKRERRQKKLKQKIKFKKIEAKAKLKLEQPDAKNSKNQNISKKLLQKITKNSGVIQPEKSESDKYLKSSTAFFSKLQNESSSKITKSGLDLQKTKLGKKISTKKSSCKLRS